MEETRSLAPADTVYVSVITEGSAPRATLTARWTYGDGQFVDESTQTITPRDLDGVSAGTKDFEVKS